MDAARKSRGIPCVSTRFSLSMRRGRLTRDGTTELSRDHILRRVRGMGIYIFPIQLTTSRIGNITRLIHTLSVMTIHTYYCIFFLWQIKERRLVNNDQIKHRYSYFYLSTWYSTYMSKEERNLALSPCPLHTNSGCGKERRISIGPW